MSAQQGPQRSQIVERYLRSLQQRIVDALAALDGRAFRQDSWIRPAGGGGVSCLIEEGDLIERGGVNFSHVMGEQLPPSGTKLEAFGSSPRVRGTGWRQSKTPR